MNNDEKPTIYKVTGQAAQVEQLKLALSIAKDCLSPIPGMCGNPDASEACRLIMKRTFKALGAIALAERGE